jgi:hypothetical protein
MQSWFFLVVSLDSAEFQRVNDLRQRPEKLWACALQIAKQLDYSPKPPHDGHSQPFYRRSQAHMTHRSLPSAKDRQPSYAAKAYMQN